MTDKHDDLTRRAAELGECVLRTRSTAAELVAETEQLAYRVAEARKTRARALEQIRERRARGTAADTGEGDIPGSDPSPETAVVPGEHARNGAPCGSLAGEAGAAAGMLDPDEVTALAALLEELGARDRRDPLCAQALQAAALLRRRVAAGHRHGHRPRDGGPEARREAGDIRDGSAEGRDALAAERDRRADARDDRSVERDRLADDADGQSWAAEQRVRDLLWDAELRDKDAAAHAAEQLPASGGTEGQRWQLDQELAEVGRVCNAEDREAIREMLSRARADRHAARRGRWADGQDRVAGRQDRGDAQADRQAATADRHAARGDRDQTVIEGEEEVPPGTVTSSA
jgi:hypothetical protein